MNSTSMRLKTPISCRVDASW